MTGGGTVSTRLETARLVIRTFEARDAGPWLAMVTDSEVTRFLPPAPRSDRTMELARRVIGERQALERELGHAMWAVEEKTTGMFVGQCGLRPVDEGAGPEIDLAYHYTRASWNKGYGTEAAIAVLAHGLGPVGLDAIMAVVVPENAVRAENLVRGCDQRSCPPSRPAMMITAHVPAVHVPPDHADGLMAAVVQVSGSLEDR